MEFNRFDTRSFPQVESKLHSFIARVYAWMFFALMVTGIVAMVIASSPTIADAIISNQMVFFGLLVGELVMVVGLVGLVRRMTPLVATLVFIAYSALNGIVFSLIFLAFTATSIATTFFIASATFGAMSIYGYVTKRDLTRLGSLLMMGLIGIIIAFVVNIFLANSILYWITSVIGILIFVGLTAFDTQKIKRMNSQVDVGTGEGEKAAVLGALALYLDFINLFLLLLNFTGQRN
jgi:FtsH-binding integral membrane protein